MPRATHADLTEEQMIEIDAMFVRFDADRSNTIDDTEMGKLLRSLGQSPSEAEVREVIARFDANNDGVIDIDEFYHLMADRLNLADDPLQELCGALDTFNRGDGTVSLSHLRLLVTSHGEVMSQGDVDEVLRAVVGDVDTTDDLATDHVNIEWFARQLCSTLAADTSLTDAAPQTMAQRLAQFWSGSLEPYRSRVSQRAAMHGVGEEDIVLRPSKANVGVPLSDSAAARDFEPLAAVLLHATGVNANTAHVAQAFAIAADPESSRPPTGEELPAEQLQQIRACAALCNVAYEHSEDEIEEEMDEMAFELIYGTVLAQPQQPAFLLSLNVGRKQALVCVRGVMTVASLAEYAVQGVVRHTFPASTPGGEEVTGMVHADVLAMAQFVQQQLSAVLDDLVHRGYKVKLCGHSLGGAVAGVLALLMKGELGPGLKCYTYGALPAVDRDLAVTAVDFCTAVSLGDDLFARADPTRLASLASQLATARQWVAADFPGDEDAAAMAQTMATVSSTWEESSSHPFQVSKVGGAHNKTMVPTSVAALASPGRQVRVQLGSAPVVSELPSFIRLSTTCLADHKPESYVAALQG